VSCNHDDSKPLVGTLWVSASVRHNAFAGCLRPDRGQQDESCCTLVVSERLSPSARERIPATALRRGAYRKQACKPRRSPLQLPLRLVAPRTSGMLPGPSRHQSLDEGAWK
jgi:hypothetical protein